MGRLWMGTVLILVMLASLVWVGAIIPNARVPEVVVFGVNDGIDPGALEDVWQGPTPQINWIDAAQTVWISSDNTGDTQDVSVIGLDSNWRTQRETVALAGNSFVPLAAPYACMNGARTASPVGLAGTVYFSKSDDDTDGNGIPDDPADVLMVISPADNRTAQTSFCTPSDAPFLYAFNWCFGVASAFPAGEATFRIRMREPDGPWTTHGVQRVNSQNSPACVPLSLIVPQRSQVRCEILGAAAMNTIGLCSMDLYRR